VRALAFRDGRPPVRPGQFQRYRQLLRQYAREPLPWGHWLRYTLARLLCGRGHFAPYLDQERWETRYRSKTVRSLRVAVPARHRPARGLSFRARCELAEEKAGAKR
jgi:hypothetical protein